MSGTGLMKIQLSKVGGKWLYSHLQVISSKMMMDGKPFNPGAMPSPPNKEAQ